MRTFFLTVWVGVTLCGCVALPISKREADRRGIPTGKPFDVEGAAAKAARALERIQAGRFAEARRDLQYALDLALALKDTGQREILEAIPALHYGLACIDALASTGRSGPTDPPGAVDSILALEWQRRALDHLRRAVRTGFRDLDHARNDPALAAIRGLPGFEAALKRPAGGRAGMFGRARK